MFRFAPFSPSATSPNFNGFTLVLPALTLGNVGQLAVDLMLNTLLPHGTELLGYIESSLLLPISGANPFGIEKGGLAASLEVYFAPGLQVVFLQQRTPVVPHQAENFANELSSWVKGSGFKEVILLCSADASRRIDRQLVGTQRRHICNDKFPAERLKGLSKPAEVPEDALKPKGLARRLLDSLSAQSIPALALILFCFEGYNIPEGRLMADWLAAVLGKQRFGSALPPVVGSGEESSLPTMEMFPVDELAPLEQYAWKPPPSWEAIQKEPVPTSLFL